MSWHKLSAYFFPDIEDNVSVDYLQTYRDICKIIDKFLFSEMIPDVIETVQSALGVDDYDYGKVCDKNWVVPLRQFIFQIIQTLVKTHYVLKEQLSKCVLDLKTTFLQLTFNSEKHWFGHVFSFLD